MRVAVNFLYYGWRVAGDAFRAFIAADGWVAVAALEPHFWRRLAQAVGSESPSPEQLATFFAERRADEWEAWGREQDVPIAAVRAGLAKE